MKNSWLPIIIQAIVLISLQVLIFQHMVFGWNGVHYVQIFIYPLVLLHLPIRMAKSIVVLIGFALGMIIDLFYLSPGIHAGAATATAFFRSPILSFFEPRTGYNVNILPTKFHLGINWYIAYAASMLSIHIFMYYSLEVFTLVYFLEIWLRTLFSLFFTLIFAIMYQYLLNPKVAP